MPSQGAIVQHVLQFKTEVLLYKSQERDINGFNVAEGRQL